IGAHTLWHSTVSSAMVNGMFRLACPPGASRPMRIEDRPMKVCAAGSGEFVITFEETYDEDVQGHVRANLHTVRGRRRVGRRGNAKDAYRLADRERRPHHP